MTLAYSSAFTVLILRLPLQERTGACRERDSGPGEELALLWAAAGGPDLH